MEQVDDEFITVGRDRVRGEKKSRKEKIQKKATVRTREEWKQIYPRYPYADDGYLVSYLPHERQLHMDALNKYGFVVVKVLSDDQCDATVPEFFHDANCNERGVEVRKITADDPSTWEQWPSRGKFLFTKSAFGQKAFENRTDENVYEVFRGIYQEDKLLCSIDKWGVMRGTKNMSFVDANGTVEIRDRPDWHYELRMHWDLNPWLYVPEMKENHHRMYQGLVALVDCPEEVGGFLIVPGSSAYLPVWTQEHDAVHMLPHSIQVTDQIMLDHQQRVPLRKGEMVIWDSGSAHANFANTTNHLRIYQFIRMLPVCNRCKERDRFCSPRVLGALSSAERTAVDDLNLTPLGRRLAGLERWD